MNSFQFLAPSTLESENNWTNCSLLRRVPQNLAKFSAIIKMIYLTLPAVGTLCSVSCFLRNQLMAVTVPSSERFLKFPFSKWAERNGNSSAFWWMEVSRSQDFKCKKNHRNSTLGFDSNEVIKVAAFFMLLSENHSETKFCLILFQAYPFPKNVRRETY